ncbi:DUF7857 domain-containing protein [Halolamina sediminis]|jgi:hypothetical protein|uniref:DUF7857 domain-containing protein n=1 Tax=Halolamina sediminis TaxID=1480675 RepID=UPI0006B556AB|nr:hypothetical protein [Halolamina sediminis]
MELDWTQESAAGVTLVRVRLRNERATDRRVRLRNRLDGPVLPPRRHGVPAAGWDRDGVTEVVPANQTVALGYASPAPTTAPPVTIDEVGRVEEESDHSTSEAAVRELGDHRPPRAVLGGESESDRGKTGGERSVVDRTADTIDDQRDTTDGRSARHASLPDEAGVLLAPYRTRIRTAEALNTAGVVEATALLDANGSLAGVESLAADLDADARELRALARAADALAARAAATAPPTDALRRLS